MSAPRTTSGYIIFFRGNDWDKNLSPEELQKVTSDFMAWFERLSAAQLAQVHDWFSRFTYREMAEKILDAFHVAISLNQLTRYYARFSQAQLFNTVQNPPLTPAGLLAIQNADPIPDEINLRHLKQQCLRILKRPNVNTDDLKYLHDVVTYEQRFRWKQHRNDLDEKWIAFRKRQLEFREEVCRRQVVVDERLRQSKSNHDPQPPNAAAEESIGQKKFPVLAADLRSSS